MRILPAYLIVAVTYYLLMDWGNLEWGRFLYNLSGLCILEGRLDFWFIDRLRKARLAPSFTAVLIKHKFSILLPFIMLCVFAVCVSCPLKSLWTGWPSSFGDLLAQVHEKRFVCRSGYGV